MMIVLGANWHQSFRKVTILFNFFGEIIKFLPWIIFLIDSISTSICVLCHTAIGTIDHLLLLCPSFLGLIEDSIYLDHVLEHLARIELSYY